MKKYNKITKNTNIDMSNYIISYEILKNGISIKYPNSTKFKPTNNEEEKLAQIKLVEEQIKAQTKNLFKELYHNNYEELSNDIVKQKKKTIRNITLLTLGFTSLIIISTIIFYPNNLTYLAPVVIGCVMCEGFVKGMFAQKEILKFKEDLKQRINCIETEDILNKSLAETKDLTQTDTSIKTISNNLENNYNYKYTPNNTNISQDLSTQEHEINNTNIKVRKKRKKVTSHHFLK